MLINKIIYGILMLIAFWFLLVYPGYLPVILFLFFTIWPLVLWALSIYMNANIEMDCRAEENLCHKDQGVELKIFVKNKCFMPVTKGELAVSYEYPNHCQNGREKIYIWAHSRSEKSFPVKIQTPYAGKLNIHVERLVLYDYFRLFKRKKRIDYSKTVTVYPALNKLNLVVEQKRYVNTLDSETYSDAIHGDDPSEIFGIREYIPGDKIQRIHWKLSSRTDELVIKEFSQPVTYPTIILIDLEPCGHGMERIKTVDGLLETVFSLSYSMLLEEYPHYLSWYEYRDARFKHQGIKDLETMYEALNEVFEIQENTLARQGFISCKSTLGRDTMFDNLLYVTNLADSLTIAELLDSRLSKNYKILNVYGEPLEDTAFAEENCEIYDITPGSIVSDVQGLIL